MKRSTALFALPILFFAISFASVKPSSAKVRPVKNIILLIGDGMGTSAIYAGYTYNNGFLNLERMKTIGLSKTYSTSFITDSGAGGTAIATGHKTFNGAIGVDAEGRPVKSILEWAEDQGKATGLISTSAITHATPASFIAHQGKRGDYESIAADFLKVDVDLFIGGGLNHFIRRKDGRDLTADLEQKGYLVTRDLKSVGDTDDLPLAALLDTVHMPKWIEGRGNMLPESVSHAIRLLSKDKDGFFLMVEGSQIDWGGHANDIRYLATEMVDFDRAVGLALDFAESNGQTLVIVTADHETGGLSINGGNLAQGDVKAGFTTTDHTGVWVPVFAAGAGCENFAGFQENTDIFHKMMTAFDIKSINTRK